jgi:hypothetical protein
VTPNIVNIAGVVSLDTAPVITVASTPEIVNTAGVVL